LNMGIASIFGELNIYNIQNILMLYIFNSPKIEAIPMFKRRARSEERKNEKYKRILSEGRDVLMKKGIEGFSMRALARKLAMSKGNLYNYVKSKRELWFGIITLEYDEFESKIRKIAEENAEKSNIDILVELGNFFLNFCSEDYRRYQLMFLTPPPFSKTRGPIEENFEHDNILAFIRSIFQKAINNHEIKETDVHSLTLYYWGLVLGAAKIEANLEQMNLFMQNYFNDKGKYSQKDFRNFFMQKTAEQLRKS
jgi:AcrR family transcriptional regulator